MHCPACSKTLREVEHHGVDIDACDCGGMWFDRGELAAWSERQGRVPEPALRGEPMVRIDGSHGRCPRCERDRLQRFERGELRGASCRECGGVWLTTDDVARLQRRLGSEWSGGTTGGTWGVSIVDGFFGLLTELIGW